MINLFNINVLRNVEHYKFISSVCAIFEKYGVEHVTIAALLDKLAAYVTDAEAAMTFEQRNDKVREKNEICLYRDKLHSKLFNYLKSILYDEKDERFDNAQAIMKIVKDMGNPSRMPENVESAMLMALGAKLEPYSEQVDAIGAKKMVDDLMNTNKKFIELEQQTRELTANIKAAKPVSMTELRKNINPIYRALTGILNGYAIEPDINKDTWKSVVDEMNVLVAKYDHLISTRKRK